MAAVPPGTLAALREGEGLRLAYPPPADTPLYIAVHPDALKAGNRNRLTQAIASSDGRLAWVGAIDERMLELPHGPPLPTARVLLAERLFLGADVWAVIRPGLLTAPGTQTPYLTVYDGERPWVVLGELSTGEALAAPLNDGRRNPKWWAPQVSRGDLLFPGSKDSQVELAHVWSFTRPQPQIGGIAPKARPELREAVEKYVG